MMTHRSQLTILIATLALMPVSAWSDDHPYTPNVEPASEEGRRAIAGFAKPDDLQVELFAAEPMLANPVAFAIDRSNRFYVAETFRLHAGVTDIRQHMDWLERDLSSRTVEDRVAMYEERLTPEEFARWGAEHDRIRRIVDADGDGRADEATVFADGFDGQQTGIGAGLVARGDMVWFTNIPHLWKLRDADDDGRAESREILSSGYGVHVGFLGHDLHGAIIGPDGKLYFSIGDRGINVLDPEGKPAHFIPDTGSILRCDPETGWPLEVVATGLRNPQELAFNELGDLFTVDNNSDSGDQARLVQVVEGGDSGWRIGYQFLQEPVSRGPWNAEKLWYPEPDNTAAYLLPPLANLSDGPSGLAYNPGVTLLPDRYQGHLFLADFRGSPGQSGIRALAVEQEGASYTLKRNEQFLWGLQATDVDFGTDGALYVSDWVEGWGMTGKGRIYRVLSTDQPEAAAAREVQEILADGMADRPLDQLAELLGHDDMRIRLDAQFELVARAQKELLGTASGDQTAPAYLALQATLRDANAPDRSRRHAVWGLRQLAAKGSPLAITELTAHLEDRDPEIRTQVALALSDGNWSATGQASVVSDRSRVLTALLTDDSARVRMAAALALGRGGRAESVRPLLEMLRANADGDVMLRHAGVMGLAGIGDETALLAGQGDESPSVRLGVLLALRRLGSPEVAQFLGDESPLIVLEAARAINDGPIEAAQARLAAVHPEADMPEALLRRIVNANLRVGQAQNARNLAEIAGSETLGDPIREMALGALADWPDPNDIDAIVGVWRPLDARPTGPAVAALGSVLGTLLSDGSEDLRRAASRAASSLGMREAVPALLALLNDVDTGPRSRVEALRSLESLSAEGLVDAARQAMSDPGAPVRSEALRILSRLSPAEAIPGLTEVLRAGDLEARQQAFATLGSMEAPEADPILVAWLDQLLEGKAEPSIHLDLIEAARARSNDEIRKRLDEHEATLASDDPLAPFRLAMMGGNVERGVEIFREKTAVSCLRCHKVDGKGGEVGPDLTGIGAKKDREYLLRSIVLPSAEIAEGFETVVVALADGQVLSGVSKGIEDGMLRLMTPEGELKLVPESEIEERATGASAMPQDLIQQLSLSELRDLIEFLSLSDEQHREAF